MLSVLILLTGVVASTGCDGPIYPLDADFFSAQELTEFLIGIDAKPGQTINQVLQQPCSTGSLFQAGWLQLRAVGPKPIEPLFLRIPARAAPTICVHWPGPKEYQNQCQGHGQIYGPATQYLFPWPDALVQDQPIIIELRDRLLPVAPISLVTLSGHRKAEQFAAASTGLVAGLLSSIVIICGLAWIVVGRTGYLTAAGMFLFGGLAWLALSGRGFSVPTSLGLWLARSGPLLSVQLAWLCVLAYVMGYLKLREQGPDWQRLTLLSAVVANALVAAQAVFWPAAALPLLVGLCLLNVIVILSVILMQMLTGSHRARFLTAAFSLPFLAAIASTLGWVSASVDLHRLASVLLLAGLFICPIVLVASVYLRYGRLEVERNNAESALATEQRVALMRASYCRITGLPRRDKLAEWLGRLLAEADPTKVKIGVFLVHLGNLHQIRRQHGRDVLEKLIRMTSERLRGGLDDEQLLGRLEDLELVVVVPTQADGEAARERLAQAAQNIRENIQAPIEIGELRLSLAPSIGLAVWPQHGDSFRQLLRRCDSALYEAQNTGESEFKVFDEKIHSARTHQFQRVNELKRAMERDELELYYQPVHDAVSNQVTSIEALIRWQHPEDGMLSPATFIPLAEDTQLILDIGYWTLHAAAHDLTSFMERGLELPIAINVSPRQFAAPGFIGYIREIVYHNTFSPELLRLEITENSLIHNWDRTQFALTDLRNLGVKVYIDDFGVGYSSLNYVRSLPIEGLKIDRSFVKNIGQTSQDEAVVNTIVRLAQSLDLQIIAEGVESAYQRDFLRVEGCHSLQGHLFSAPLDKNALYDYLKRIEFDPVKIA